jgi:hypothetical protein
VDETAETGRAVNGAVSDEEMTVLDFERLWWKYAGAKEKAVRDVFGWSMTRYYQVLNALIDTPRALAADPVLVNRLLRLRDERQQQRSSSRLDT